MESHAWAHADAEDTRCQLAEDALEGSTCAVY